MSTSERVVGHNNSFSLLVLDQAMQCSDPSLVVEISDEFDQGACRPAWSAEDKKAWQRDKLHVEKPPEPDPSFGYRL